MKTTEDDIIMETAFAIEDCVERDSNDEITGIDHGGIKAILVGLIHRLRSGHTSIEEAVIQKIRDRAGQVKYGSTMERDDVQRLAHQQEVMIDGAIYLEKMIQDSTDEL